MFRFIVSSIALLGLSIALGAGTRDANAASGSVYGWAQASSGTVVVVNATSPLTVMNPTGVAQSGGDPLNVAAGVDLGILGNIAVGVTSGTVVRHCEGDASAATVWAECYSRVEGLSIGLNLPVLLGGGNISVLSASVLEARARCTSSGGVPVCVDTGTTVTNLCVLGNGCINVNGSAVLAVSVPLVASGTVEIGQRVWRSTQGAMTGEGLTVSLLSVDLNLLPSLAGGLSIVDLSLATADAFLGDVAPDPTPTATPTATATSTPPPGSTATPTATATSTPPPGSTATPTATATSTPPPGSTATPTATATSTPVAGATATPTGPSAPPTATPPGFVPTATATPVEPSLPLLPPTATPAPGKPGTQPPYPFPTPKPPATGAGANQETVTTGIVTCIGLGLIVISLASFLLPARRRRDR